MYYYAPFANLTRGKENIFNAVNNPSFCICTSNNTSLTAVIFNKEPSWCITNAEMETCRESKSSYIVWFGVAAIYCNNKWLKMHDTTQYWP